MHFISIKGSFLYRLLRPELVRSNPVPLSSDAFSKWPIEDAHSHNIEVMEATRRLETEVLPDCAAFLDKYYQDVPLDSMDLSDEFIKLTNTIHRRGSPLVHHIAIFATYS